MNLDKALKAQDSAAFNPPHSELDESEHDLAVAEAIDDILDDQYEVLLTLTDFIDEDDAESSLRALFNSYQLGDDKALLSVAKGLAGMLSDKLKERAESEVLA